MSQVAPSTIKLTGSDISDRPRYDMFSGTLNSTQSINLTLVNCMVNPFASAASGWQVSHELLLMTLTTCNSMNTKHCPLVLYMRMVDDGAEKMIANASLLLNLM